MRLKCWNAVIFRPANLIPNLVARPDCCGWHRKHLAIILSQRTLYHENKLRAAMKNRLVMAPEYHGAVMELKISLALLSCSFVFFTEVKGGWCGGTDAKIAWEPIPKRFWKIFYRVPKVAILNVVSVVEMTSYHILLNGNFDIFRSIRSIRSESVRAVYPAWTAIEFSGLRRRSA